VAGGDLSIRFKRRHQFSATFLESQTRAEGSGPASGGAQQVSYSFSDRKYRFSTQLENYDRDFQMDTAFYNRTGFTSGWAYGARDFYPKDANRAVLKRVSVFTWNKYGHDRIQDGNERFSLVGAQFSFTRQGSLRVDYGIGREPWAGRRFRNDRLQTFGQVQLFRWLYLNGYFRNGSATFYDPVNPFQGRSRASNFSLGFQPGRRFNQNVGYNRVRFSRASDGSHVYTVHIVNLRTTYQFNKRFFVRAIEQFDSSRRRLLTDLLASYEIVPGTVFHAGYGSLFENRDSREYLTTNRGIFFKASYLHRF
jgi:hypothetical protein